MTKLAIFQHVSWEGPGKFLHSAAAHCGVDCKVIKIWQDPVPDLTFYDGLIILGGGPNVDQEDKYPFLRPEKEAIRNWLTSDRPCLGICLGHQLLADALGARVGPNFCHSIGFTEGHLTGDGRHHPVFASIDNHFPLFKWHGYAVLPPVPRHFHILATSKECQIEAFTLKERPHIIGVQFDNHAAHPEDVAAWIHNDSSWLRSLPNKNINPRLILAETVRRHHEMEHQFELFFENFITIVRNRERSS
ncbi:MAG: type 1 glutamine amidotransferase [Pseudomonadota bacterium]